MKMAELLLTGLPFEALHLIFEFVIYSRNDINEYLKSIEKDKPLSGGGENKALLRKQELRLVCTTFRDVIDSTTFWANKTLKISKRANENNRWLFMQKIGVRSIMVTPDVSMHRPLVKLSSLQNLIDLTYDCLSDDTSFQLLQLVSKIPLQSLKLSSVMLWHGYGQEVEENFECFLTTLTHFSKSLKKITLEADNRRATLQAYFKKWNVKRETFWEVCNKYMLKKIRNHLWHCKPIANWCVTYSWR